MAELDPFEMRLASAVRRYLADAPVEVDGAAIARRAAADRSWRRSLLPDVGPVARVPRAAWVLAVVALTILALAAALFAGARPERPLPALVPPVAVTACPAGSTPDEPGPADQPRPLSQHLRMAFDRGSGRIVAVVPDDRGTGWTTWVFDVCSNAWSRPEAVGAPRPGPVEWPEPNLVYDADSDLTIAIDRGQFAPLAYDLEADAWATKGEWPALGDSMPRLAYDPVSGLVYVQRISSGDEAAPAQDLWTYDVDTDSREIVRQTGSIPPGTSGDHLLLAYDTSVDRIVAVQSHLNHLFTWQLDPRTSTWTASTVGTPSFNTGWVGSGGEIAFDEAGARTVMFSDGLVAAYDAAADRWETLRRDDATPGSTGPLNRVGHWMAYDPLNERLVVSGGQYRAAEGWVRANDVWAFDRATGEWIELLAPSRVERYDEATDSWIDLASEESVSPATTD